MGPSRITQTEYWRIFNTKECMVMSEHDYDPPDGIPGVCDECGEPATSECMCGEMYCSRKCLNKVWGDHRSICETVRKLRSACAVTPGLGRRLNVAHHGWFLLFLFFTRLLRTSWVEVCVCADSGSSH